jgi:hypothetical protein
MRHLGGRKSGVSRMPLGLQVRTQRLMPNLFLPISENSSHILLTGPLAPPIVHCSARSTYRFDWARVSSPFAATLAPHPNCHGSEPHPAAVCSGSLWCVRAVKLQVSHQFSQTLRTGVLTPGSWGMGTHTHDRGYGTSSTQVDPQERCRERVRR